MSRRPRGLEAITSLGRSIDLRYASNRFAVFWTVVSFLVALVAWLVNDRPLSDAAVGAVAVAVAVFLAWALGRELDPDHPATARWAAMLALLFAAILGTPSLLAAGLLMVTARVLSRTAGQAPRVTDLVVLVAAAVLAAHTIAGAVAALVLATALVLDLRYPDPAPTGPTAAAAIAIIAGGGLRLVAASPPPWATPDTPELVIGVLVLVGLAAEPPTALASIGDASSRPLDPQRLAAARRLALVAVPVALLVGGQDEVTRLSPVVAALAGLGLNNVRRRVRSR